MIYALTKPPEEYDIETPAGRFGLYESYGHDPHLFCLLSRTNPVFFMWEDMLQDMPKEQRVVKLPPEHEDLYLKAIEQSLSGRTVRELMENMSPREFAKFMSLSDTTEFSLVKVFGTEHTVAKQVLVTATYARVFQHEKFYRGGIYKAGNKTEVAFKSRLTKSEDNSLGQIKKQLRQHILDKVRKEKA